MAAWWSAMPIPTSPMASLQFFSTPVQITMPEIWDFLQNQCLHILHLPQKYDLLSRKNPWKNPEKTPSTASLASIGWAAKGLLLVHHLPPQIGGLWRKLLGAMGCPTQVHQKIQNSPGSGLIRVGFFDPADPGLDSFTLGKTLRSVQRKYFQ